MRRSGPPPRGFTLIEVLIALAVLAIGLIAVLGTAGTSTRLAAELRDRTLAHYVAMNALTELRLSAAWTPGAKPSGETEMGGERWRWQAHISTTPDPDLLRVDVDVRNAREPDTVVSSLIGFYGRAIPFGLPPPTSPVNSAAPGKPPGGSPP